MHMHVDCTGKHVHAGNINRFARRRHCVDRADAQNFPVLDGDGPANVKLADLNVSKQLQVNTGNQADTIVISMP